MPTNIMTYNHELIVEIEKDIKRGMKIGVFILLIRWAQLAFIFIVGVHELYILYLVDILVISICLSGLHFKNRMAASLTLLIFTMGVVINFSRQMIEGGSPSLLGFLLSIAILLVFSQSVIGTFKYYRVIAAKQGAAADMAHLHRRPFGKRKGLQE